MKILIIGDPHGKLPKNLTQIIKKNKIKLIICTGDFPLTPKNPTDPKSWIGFKTKANKSYKKIIDKLCSYKLPILTLKGNMFLKKSSKRITKRIFSKYKNLYYKKTGKINLKKTNFIFFDMIWESYNSRTVNRQNKYLKENKSREKKLNQLLKETKNSILISHVPPYGILDKLNFPGISKELKNKSVGSKILLKAIRKHKPKYVICGHIHEAKGIKKLGKTIIINAGCCGDYRIINIK